MNNHHKQVYASLYVSFNDDRWDIHHHRQQQRHITHELAGRIADAANALETNLCRLNAYDIMPVVRAFTTQWNIMEKLPSYRVDKLFENCRNAVWAICERTAKRDVETRRNLFCLADSWHIVTAWHPTYTVIPQVIAWRARPIIFVNRITIVPVSAHIASLAFSNAGFNRQYLELSISWVHEERSDILRDITAVTRLLNGEQAGRDEFLQRLARGSRGEGARIKGIGNILFRIHEKGD